LDAAALNQWVLQMASELRSSRLAQHASILLAHHLRRTLDPLMRMEFLRIKRSADMAAGDKRAAMAAGLELATLSEVHLREDLVSIGSAWYMLGRIGMSEATWLERRNHAFADAMVQVPAAKRAATSSSESLAAAAQQLLRAAFTGAGEVDFHTEPFADGAKLPSDARDQFLVGYINATSSALKALNMLRKDTTAALNLSRALAGKLAAVQTIPVHEGFDYESDCLAPSLVNIAVGELAAQSGDAGRALDSIKRAVLIQEKSADRADVDALRTLSYALYAAGDLTRARYVAEEAARRWSKSTGRAYSDSQMMVGGKNISLEALLRGQ
jgi:tetratricopeptide (TPR) repeat protein